MIKKEYYMTREDGVELYKTYSDTDREIINKRTGIVYGEAIDIMGDEEYEEDPILYTPPIEIYEGRYYIQDNVLYLFYAQERDCGTALSHSLQNLINIYVISKV